jgi:cobaltochelatase CobS
LIVNDEGVQVTTWKEGVFTRCWREGYFIVFDEITAASSNMMLRLHGPLDGDALTLSDNGGMVIPKGERTRIFATDNTNGRGDETGLFTGTSVLNEATLDRFGTTVKYGYPCKESEVKILMDKTGIDFNAATIMVDIAQKIRMSFLNDECSCTLSTRRLINWARKTVRMGDVRKAAYIAIINKLNKQDADFVNGVIQRFFGGKI